MLAPEFNGELGNARDSGSDVRLGCKVPSAPSPTPKASPLDLTCFPES
jgi:hypothetical protein